MGTLDPPWVCHRWAQSSKQVPGAGQQVQVGESFAAFLTRQAYGKYQPQRQAYGKPRLDGQERRAESFAQPQDFTRGLPRSSFDGYTRLARLVGSKRVQVVSANRLWDENRTVRLLTPTILALAILPDPTPHSWSILKPSPSLGPSPSLSPAQS